MSQPNGQANGPLASELQKLVEENVFRASESMPSDSTPVKGYDFSKGVDYRELLKSFKTVGFQALHFGQAVEEINKMIAKKLEAAPQAELEELNYFQNGRRITNCTIFLGFTSNMISSGVRETIRYLVQNNMVDCLVTTAGGIEEDLMKCMAPTYLGDFSIRGAELRKRGINRIGNLLIPNNNYCKLEEWMYPILDSMLQEQNSQGVNWTPSKFIARLGQEINHRESVLYWAYKNKIPIFSPAVTDGAIGDNLYFHSFKNPGLRLDIVEDIGRINKMSMQSRNSGMIILGGGLIKHHICNANMMRNGADFSVFVNTAQEFDGSDSGARPDEAVSWGKIKVEASPVKVYGEATLVFPLLVAETFATNFNRTTGDS